MDELEPRISLIPVEHTLDVGSDIDTSGLCIIGCFDLCMHSNQDVKAGALTFFRDNNIHFESTGLIGCVSGPKPFLEIVAALAELTLDGAHHVCGKTISSGPKTVVVRVSVMIDIELGFPKRSRCISSVYIHLQTEPLDPGCSNGTCGVRGCTIHFPVTHKMLRLTHLFDSLSRPLSVSPAPPSGSLLFEVPAESLSTILTFLDSTSLMEFGRTCKFARHIVTSIGVIPGLDLQLYEHQCQSLQWMLHREATAHVIENPLCRSFVLRNDCLMTVDMLSGEITSGNECKIPDVRGGMLCDDPGLGKTVTVLALILRTLPRGTRPVISLDPLPSDPAVCSIQDRYLDECCAAINAKRPAIGDVVDLFLPSKQVWVFGTVEKVEGRRAAEEKLTGRKSVKAGAPARVKKVSLGGPECPRGLGNEGSRTLTGSETPGWLHIRVDLCSDDLSALFGCDGGGWADVSGRVFRVSRRATPALVAPLHAYTEASTESSRRTFTVFVTNVISQLEGLDTLCVFSRPVSDAEAPGYSALIRSPMSFDAMWARAKEGCYHSLHQVWEDFMLLLGNCTRYNAEGSWHHTYACDFLPKGCDVFRCTLESLAANCGASARADAVGPLLTPNELPRRRQPRSSPRATPNGSASAVITGGHLVLTPPRSVPTSAELSPVRDRNSDSPEAPRLSQYSVAEYSPPVPTNQPTSPLASPAQSARARHRLVPSHATLIIVPAVLLRHWNTQILTHCPSLRAYFDFAFIEKHSCKNGSSLPSETDLSRYDVVVIPASRLSREWERRPPMATVSPRRRNGNEAAWKHQDFVCSAGASFARVLGVSETDVVTPLMKVCWRRIVVDEGHTLGSNSSSCITELARALPSRCRWVMTGTPTRAAVETEKLRVKDLHELPRFGKECESSDDTADYEDATRNASLQHLRGLLSFLREGVYIGDDGGKNWTRAINGPILEHDPVALGRLRSLLERLMVRHTKRSVMRLPPPTYTTTRLSLTATERNAYNTVVEIIQRNLTITSLNPRYGRNHPDSFLHRSNRKFATEVVSNLRLSCCGGGSMAIWQSPQDRHETLAMLRASLHSIFENTVVDVRPLSSRVGTGTRGLRDMGAEAPTGPIYDTSSASPTLDRSRIFDRCSDSGRGQAMPKPDTDSKGGANWNNIEADVRGGNIGIETFVRKGDIETGVRRGDIETGVRRGDIETGVRRGDIET
eukprot:Rmarinus@m.27276